MSTDEQNNPGGGDEESEAERIKHAADDPTAMWDESALREAGMDSLPASSAGRPPPATGPDVGGDSRASVVVSSTATGRHRAQPPAPRGGGLSWAATIGLATVLGVAVYFLVRFLKG